jgi:hypothetical protein
MNKNTYIIVTKYGGDKMSEFLRVGAKIEGWKDFSLAVLIALAVFIGDFILRHLPS